MEPSFLDNGYRSPSIRRIGIVEVDVRGMASLPDLDSYPLLFHLSEIKERHYLERKDNANETITGTNADTQIKPEDTQLSTPPQTHRRHSSAQCRSDYAMGGCRSVGHRAIAWHRGEPTRVHDAGRYQQERKRIGKRPILRWYVGFFRFGYQGHEEDRQEDEAKTVEYTAAEGSVLEGDYVLNGYSITDRSSSSWRSPAPRRRSPPN